MKTQYCISVLVHEQLVFQNCIELDCDLNEYVGYTKGPLRNIDEDALQILCTTKLYQTDTLLLKYGNFRVKGGEKQAITI